MDKMQITLELTPKQLKIMRNCLSDLGRKDADCVSIQLVLADAILEVATDEQLTEMRKY